MILPVFPQFDSSTIVALVVSWSIVWVNNVECLQCKISGAAFPFRLKHVEFNSNQERITGWYLVQL